jgi:hypothetical protein
VTPSAIPMTAGLWAEKGQAREQVAEWVETDQKRLRQRSELRNVAEKRAERRLRR